MTILGQIVGLIWGHLFGQGGWRFEGKDRDGLLFGLLAARYGLAGGRLQAGGGRDRRGGGR